MIFNFTEEEKIELIQASVTEIKFRHYEEINKSIKNLIDHVNCLIEK